MSCKWRILIAALVLVQAASAQNFWFYNQRTHPELEWSTIQTEHFRIHYHQGIEITAQKTARIAEQTYQPIMDQLWLEDFGITDIVLSAEDEVMNGFPLHRSALPSRVSSTPFPQQKLSLRRPPGLPGQSFSQLRQSSPGSQIPS